MTISYGQTHHLLDIQSTQVGVSSKECVDSGHLGVASSNRGAAAPLVGMAVVAARGHSQHCSTIRALCVTPITGSPTVGLSAHIKQPE